MSDPVETAINCLEKMSDLEKKKDISIAEIIYCRSKESIAKQRKIGAEMVQVSKEYLKILRENCLDPIVVRKLYHESLTKVNNFSPKISTELEFHFDDQGWSADELVDDSFFNDPLPGFLQKHVDMPPNEIDSEWEIQKKPTGRRRRGRH